MGLNLETKEITINKHGSKFPSCSKEPIFSLLANVELVFFILNALRLPIVYYLVTIALVLSSANVSLLSVILLG